jgi:hypothetical protein
MSNPVHGDLRIKRVKTVGVDAYTQSIHVVNVSVVDTIWVTVDGSIPTVDGGGTAFPCTDNIQIPTISLTDIVIVRMISATEGSFIVWGDPVPDNPSEQ